LEKLRWCEKNFWKGLFFVENMILVETFSQWVQKTNFHKNFFDSFSLEMMTFHMYDTFSGMDSALSGYCSRFTLLYRKFLCNCIRLHVPEIFDWI